MSVEKKNRIDVRDLMPSTDAKGGRHGHHGHHQGHHLHSGGGKRHRDETRGPEDRAPWL